MTCCFIGFAQGGQVTTRSVRVWCVVGSAVWPRIKRRSSCLSVWHGRSPDPGAVGTTRAIHCACQWSHIRSRTTGIREMHWTFGFQDSTWKVDFLQFWWFTPGTGRAQSRHPQYYSVYGNFSRKWWSFVFIFGQGTGKEIDQNSLLVIWQCSNLALLPGAFDASSMELYFLLKAFPFPFYSHSGPKCNVFVFQMEPWREHRAPQDASLKPPGRAFEIDCIGSNYSLRN